MQPRPDGGDGRGRGGCVVPSLLAVPLDRRSSGLTSALVGVEPGRPRARRWRSRSQHWSRATSSRRSSWAASASEPLADVQLLELVLLLDQGRDATREGRDRPCALLRRRTSLRPAADGSRAGRDHRSWADAGRHRPGAGDGRGRRPGSVRSSERPVTQLAVGCSSPTSRPRPPCPGPPSGSRRRRSTVTPARPGNQAGGRAPTPPSARAGRRGRVPTSAPSRRARGPGCGPTPAATDAMPVSPATTTGAARSTTLPSPSWPHAFQPQAHTVRRRARRRGCGSRRPRSAVTPRRRPPPGPPPAASPPRPSWPKPL